MTKLKSCFFGVIVSLVENDCFSQTPYKCVLEVEEAVSVVSFISSSPGYIVNVY